MVGHKIKRRKRAGHYLRSQIMWEPAHKETRRRANRRERHRTKVDLRL